MSLETLIEQLDENGNDFSSFEMENYEKKLFDHLTGRGIAPIQAQTFVNAIKESQTKINLGAPFALQNNVTPASVAQFDINIKRLTANIATPLPIVLLGATELNSQYKQVIGPLPTGVTYRVIGGLGSTSPEKIIFEFTDGVNTDQVEITCNQTAYINFITSTVTDLLKVMKTRYRINDAVNGQSQFSQELKVIKKSMFGFSTENDFPVGASINPGDFKNDLIDINMVYDIDKETNMRLKIIPLANFEISLSMFLSKFKRQNATGF